jgi:hypothetical protein
VQPEVLNGAKIPQLEQHQRGEKHQCRSSKPATLALSQHTGLFGAQARSGKKKEKEKRKQK